MEQEPRKATDVLLSLENKVDTLLNIIKAQDLNIKVLSNKLNAVMEQMAKQPAAPPQIRVEAVQAPLPANPFVQMPAGDPEKNIPVMAESKLPSSSAPGAFRRNSRPETYQGDDAILPHADEGHRMPLQIPKMPSGPAPTQMPPGARPPPGRGAGNEVVVQPTKKQSSAPPRTETFTDLPPEEQAKVARGMIPVQQRVVSGTGKSVFLAQVEITNVQTNEITKTKTTGNGKWMTTLGIGAYRVVITKRESLTKESLNATQDIQVDGSQSPLELPLLIIK